MSRDQFYPWNKCPMPEQKINFVQHRLTMFLLNSSAKVSLNFNTSNY